MQNTNIKCSTLDSIFSVKLVVFCLIRKLSSAFLLNMLDKAADNDELNDDVEMAEQKQFELYEGNDHDYQNAGRSITSNRAHYNKVTNPQYQHPQFVNARSSSISSINPNPVEVPTKVYFIAVYRILMHLLLIYCVLGVSYLLFFKISNECTCSSTITEVANSNNITNSDKPSQSPSVMKLPLEPTLMPDTPSKYPTFNPVQIQQQINHH